MDYPHYRAMQKLSEKLEAATTEWSRKQTIQEAQKVIEHFEILGGRSGVKDGRLGRLWEACCPDSWWPEDSDGPVYSEVARMITVLMGSFPTSKIPEPEIFVRVLLDDVMALGLASLKWSQRAGICGRQKNSCPQFRKWSRR